MTGEDEELEKVEAFLKKKFQLKVESGAQLSFLKRSIEVVDGVTKVKVNEKYIEGLVNLFPGVKRRKTPGDIIIDNEPLTNDIDIQKYRRRSGDAVVCVWGQARHSILHQRVGGKTSSSNSWLNEQFAQPDWLHGDDQGHSCGDDRDRSWSEFQVSS